MQNSTFTIVLESRISARTAGGSAHRVPDLARRSSYVRPSKQDREHRRTCYTRIRHLQILGSKIVNKNTSTLEAATSCDGEQDDDVWDGLIVLVCELPLQAAE
jgi:hypothetical protein